MIKGLLAALAALGLISGAVFAQSYTPMSPPSAAPPSVGVPGSTTTTTTTSPTTDHTTKITRGVDANGKKLRFLRRIPVDPMTGKDEWGLRSVQDDPDSDSWGGQNIFDVYTKSEGTGLDGTKYKTW